MRAAIHVKSPLCSSSEGSVDDSASEFIGQNQERGLWPILGGVESQATWALGLFMAGDWNSMVLKSLPTQTIVGF